MLSIFNIAIKRPATSLGIKWPMSVEFKVSSGNGRKFHILAE